MNGDPLGLNPEEEIREMCAETGSSPRRTDSAYQTAQCASVLSMSFPGIFFKYEAYRLLECGAV
jgi:hypothetical protein